LRYDVALWGLLIVNVVGIVIGRTTDPQASIKSRQHVDGDSEWRGYDDKAPAVGTIPSATSKIEMNTAVHRNDRSRRKYVHDMSRGRIIVIVMVARVIESMIGSFVRFPTAIAIAKPVPAVVGLCHRQRRHGQRRKQRDAHNALRCLAGAF
jgi:hypothetical protein